MDFDFTIIQEKYWECFELGKKAREEGLPNDYNNVPRTPSGQLLKYYKSAWDFGYSGKSFNEFFSCPNGDPL